MYLNYFKFSWDIPQFSRSVKTMTVSDLHSAVRLNDSSKVSQLIRKSKSDLESRDYLDNTPLLLAIKLG